VSLPGITADSGFLIGLERSKARAILLLKASKDKRQRIVVPVAALAEWWRGSQQHAQILKLGFNVEAMNERLAKTAGEAIASVDQASVVTRSSWRRPPRAVTWSTRPILMTCPGFEVTSVRSASSRYDPRGRAAAGRIETCASQRAMRSATSDARTSPAQCSGSLSAIASGAVSLSAEDRCDPNALCLKQLDGAPESHLSGDGLEQILGRFAPRGRRSVAGRGRGL